MNSGLTRLITLLAVLICFPLQGVAAVTMPACQSHGKTMEMQVDAGGSEAMSDCDHHQAQPASDSHHQHSDKTTGKVPCDNCFNCHLSAGQAIIPVNAAVGINGIPVMVGALTAEFTDSDPSLLFHPPRSPVAWC
ncbi:hypothetical protein MTYP_01662 [Methylophilaceae bacterium]|nr:hypothetical protein MTYP_01662 [Methylophilaceae bacterium]